MEMISGNQKSVCKLQDQICNLVPITGGPDEHMTCKVISMNYL